MYKAFVPAAFLPPSGYDLVRRQRLPRVMTPRSHTLQSSSCRAWFTSTLLALLIQRAELSQRQPKGPEQQHKYEHSPAPVLE